jgi:formylglycine-generating enzyme required for sulfatase activity
MNDEARQLLHLIVARYGLEICDDPKRCEALLRDFCGEHRREIYVLIGALREGVAADLRARNRWVPREILLARLRERLQDHLALTRDAAQWAVESWVTALGETVVGSKEEPERQMPIKTPQPPMAPSRGTVPGTVRVNPQDGLKYVWIPPGTFNMGCSPGDRRCRDDEKPAHHVTITRGFWIGQTVETVAAYRTFVVSTGGQMPWYQRDQDNQDMPIVSVNWNEATAFCRWAGGRLPTEAEWEYAARAGSTEGTYGPVDEVAWHGENSGARLHEVAQKRPNAWNLYDTLGNVEEWVNDWYGKHYYRVSPERDPRGPDTGQLHVVRGGSCGKHPDAVNVSIRLAYSPRGNHPGLGFRCVREVDIP